MCTAMACATERIAIGPAATIAPLRHPTLLAKEFTGVDRISNGRLILTLGVGGDNPKEFEAAGVPLERRGRRTQETLEILRRYFSGEPFSYEGEIFQLSDVSLDPLPVRGAATPIWVAGRREPTRRRAALLADGFLPVHDHAGELRPDVRLRAGAGRGRRTGPSRLVRLRRLRLRLSRRRPGACPPPGRRAPRLALLGASLHGRARRQVRDRRRCRGLRRGSAALRRGRRNPSRALGGAPPGRRSRGRRSGRLPRESCHTCGLVDRIRPMAAGTFRRYPFMSAFTSARNGNVSQSPVPRSACAAMTLPARAQSVTPKPSIRP